MKDTRAADAGRALSTHRSSVIVRRWVRRGNALMMAVTMTALLAIIGSSFVMVTRLQRQTVRSFVSTQALDEAQEYVIAEIQRVLADDVAYSAPVDRLRPQLPDGSVNPLYEPYDWAGWVDQNSDAQPQPAETPDAWLAPVEPTPSGRWSVLSDLSQTLGIPTGATYAAWRAAHTNVAAAVWNAYAPAGVGGPADADGDGITDSAWRPLDELESRQVWAAIRIIDNCGMLNVNTAWDAVPATLNANSPPPLVPDTFGVVNSQFNIRSILQLANFGGGPPPSGWSPAESPRRLHRALLADRMPGLELADETAGEAGMMAYAQQMVAYADAVRSLDHRFPPVGYRFFGIEEELELRHGFCLNSPVRSRLETLWWDVLGRLDPAQPAYYCRAVPYNDLLAWAQALFGLSSGTGSYRDLRHLLTTCSFDRLPRMPLPVGSIAPERLEAEKRLRVRLGEYGSLEINGLLGRLNGVSWNTPISDPANPTGPDRLKMAARPWLGALADALLYAGYSVDEAMQYVANFLDYFDTDSVPTVIAAANDATFSDHYLLVDPNGSPVLPPSGKRYYGYEAQPFISEVFSRVEKDANDKLVMARSAIELCNPYPFAISLEGWAVKHGGLQFAFRRGLSVPARVTAAGGGIRPGRLVIASDSALVQQTEPEGLSVDPQPAFLFTVESTEELKLVRPVPGSTTGEEILVDRVDGKAMEAVTGGVDPPEAGKQREYSLQRGTSQWRFARNEFQQAGGAVGTIGLCGLGLWSGKMHPPPPAEQAPGVALPVANRGIVWGNQFVRLVGLYELGRPVLIGNGFSGAASTITDAVADKIKRVLDGSSDERNVRFDFGVDPLSADPWRSRRLLSVLSVVARGTDGTDNTGAYYGYASTSADNLTECSMPGRINVNTAPAPVLRAAFPRLVDPASGVAVSDDDLMLMAGWFADAVIYMRTQSGPFDSIANFIQRVDEFNNPVAETAPIIPGLASPTAHALRFKNLLRAVDVVRGRPLSTRVIGDPFIAGDYEERDWLLGRMVNLLTVRSDVFTAYILIRVQSLANPSEFTDRRLIAIFDRSNVFLPPQMGRNLPLFHASFDKNGNGVWDPGEWYGEPFTDVNGNGRYDAGEAWTDLNANGVYDMDDSGEAVRFGPNPNDPNYFDRMYTTPKVVALQVVGDAY